MQELNVLATQKIEEIITGIENGSFEPVKQSGEVSTAPKINEMDLRIDWNDLSSEISRRVRAGSKRLNAWTIIGESKSKFCQFLKTLSKTKLHMGK